MQVTLSLPNGMKRGRGRPRKDAAPLVDPEWQASIESGTEEEIREAVAKAALANQALAQEKKDDQALAEAKSAYDAAGAVYKEGMAENKNKIKFARDILRARGKNV